MRGNPESHRKGVTESVAPASGPLYPGAVAAQSRGSRSLLCVHTYAFTRSAEL
jgi:hypothetical protein